MADRTRFACAARHAVSAAALCVALLTAACQTQLTPGQGAGDSASADVYLEQIRTEHGLPPLTADSRLEQAALQQAGYMAGVGRMEHATRRGRDFASRMEDNGIAPPSAENVAHGRMNTEKLFSIWMNSPGHRRNMLDPRFHRFGLAYVRAGKGSDQRYWALVLGK